MPWVGRHQAPAFELTGNFCSSAAHYATADKLATLKHIGFPLHIAGNCDETALRLS